MFDLDLEDASTNLKLPLDAAHYVYHHGPIIRNWSTDAAPEGVRLPWERVVLSFSTVITLSVVGEHTLGSIYSALTPLVLKIKSACLRNTRQPQARRAGPVQAILFPLIYEHFRPKRNFRIPLLPRFMIVLYRMFYF